MFRISTHFLRNILKRLEPSNHYFMVNGIKIQKMATKMVKREILNAKSI